MATKVANALDVVTKFLNDARVEKQAALGKKANDPTPPTSNPVMKADDGTVAVVEGARAKENISDVKKDIGGDPITGQEDANNVPTNAVDNIGTVKQDSNETKGNVAKPKALGDQQTREAVFGKVGSDFSKRGSALLDLLEKKAEAAPVAALTKTAEQEKLAAAEKYKADAEAGYVAAEALINTLGMSKQAAENKDAQIEAGVTGIIKAAQEDAEMYVTFLANHVAALQKKAEGELPPELMAAAGGGGAPEGMGAGLPPELLGGMGGGAPEGMGAPGGGEGGGGDEQVIEALADAMIEAGVTPEELAAAVAAEGGGGEGGGAPEGMGAPPEAALPPEGETPAEEAAEKSASIHKRASANRVNDLRKLIRGLSK